MSTTETDITDRPITDEDLAGIDESLRETVRDLYGATGNREFAITVAKNAERQLSQPGLRFALLLNVVDAAIDSGLRHDAPSGCGCSLVEMLAQLFPTPSGADVWGDALGTQDAAHAWHELDMQLAKLADLPQLPRDFYNQSRPAVRIGQYAYAATGNSDFAVALADEFETRVTKGRKTSLWQVIQSAIAAGADLDTRIRCGDLRGLLRFLNPDKDVDAEWHENAKKLAREARQVEIVRALEAEFDDDEFSTFFSTHLYWLDDKDETQLPGFVDSFFAAARRECFDMDDIAAALKTHVGIPESIVAAASEKVAQEKLDEERRDQLRAIAARYDSAEQYRNLGIGVRTMAFAARGNTSAPPAIWGQGMDVLWADGESMIFESSPGVGKTTAAGLLVRAMLLGGDVLGYPVRPLPDGQRILYLALDRPDQIVRSLLRQFTQEQLDALDLRFTIWSGPLPDDAAANDYLFTDLADIHKADVIFVDSVKDAALGLSEDRAAAIYQRGRQRLLQSGRQLCELHHLTKGGDAYGSIWLNAGVGSVVRLKGAAGGPTATLTHQKSPARRIDPIEIVHDRPNGGMAVAAEPAETEGDDAGAPEVTVASAEASIGDLATLVTEQGPEGVTAALAAERLHGSSGRNHRERAQRALNALCGDHGPLRRIDGSRGGNVKTPARWVAKSHD
ncbi:AAA family ATPase [Mycobacterium intracellulare subsp. chimaera]|uniref:AAA family ATPase n=1 Tax=Mycobacterium intracellulare TaxID=1767 RepID=UPI0009E6B9CF|nr:AAA family ATPase [Mycobacterium intracellulare]ASL09170.1 hypothetical protein MYCODSM44623_02439 [Mycobacterium intracellulare subsp. chimaera]ASL20985.1 hypothetical protein MYCOZU1_02562 [Mycobacterium intracellulare subsp. chimaera]MCV7326904.1 AAA family ATPase [Mycobacterium intracellulare subsp. chimaera]MDM3904219.1 AAA family ATPase [Mycobacterium intracellulare subsp. chimaera]QGK48569.1 AAA family ATPase [Mycobacterium intracellulare subsp. chimaera]